MRTLVNGLHRAVESSDSAKDLMPQIQVVEQTAESIARQMRALLLELRPPELTNLDLAGALAELVNAYSTRVGLAVNTDISPLRLSRPAEQALLRIAQEALNNAARHANATAIQLELTQREEGIRLTIADNGQGFTPEQIARLYGLGLHSMQARAREIGGVFVLDTAPGR